MNVKKVTNELLSKIDLDKVHTALRSVEMPEYEYDYVTDKVLFACDLWLAEDMQADVILIEHRFDSVIKGVFDVIKVKGEKCELIDWKTTKDVKRPNYLEEVKEDFQSSFYLTYGGDYIERELHLPRPSLIRYRCIDDKEVTRSSQGEEFVVAPGHVAQVTKRLDEVGQNDAEIQIANVGLAYSSQFGAGPWARNKPRACYGYDYTCPFLNDCIKMTMPTSHKDIVNIELKNPRSKSAVKDWLTCPEYYRRMYVLGERDKMKKPLHVLKGEAFHAAIASIYEQTFLATRQ